LQRDIKVAVVAAMFNSSTTAARLAESEHVVNIHQWRARAELNTTFYHPFKLV
jgi:hypothetical protein